MQAFFLGHGNGWRMCLKFTLTREKKANNIHHMGFPKPVVAGVGLVRALLVSFLLRHVTAGYLTARKSSSTPPAVCERERRQTLTL